MTVDYVEVADGVDSSMAQGGQEFECLPRRSPSACKSEVEILPKVISERNGICIIGDSSQFYKKGQYITELRSLHSSPDSISPIDSMLFR